MNLKEAFRFQNKLQMLINGAQSILDNERNICKTQTTVMHKKVMPELENETTVEVAPSDYADSIDKVVEFMLYLLREQETLAKAIHDAKAKLEIDMDSEVSLNSRRQRIAATLRHMADLRGSEQIIVNGGTGYRFNAEGNQVSYRCEAKKVTTINYNRNAVRAQVAALSKKSDDISAKLDSCMINSEVAYEPSFDVNDSFSTVLEAFAGMQEE
jgi:hypothetical protein